MGLYLRAEFVMIGRRIKVPIADPISFLLGVGLGCVLCRCVFLHWKEKEGI
jgi:hypothetical protein